MSIQEVENFRAEIEARRRRIRVINTSLRERTDAKLLDERQRLEVEIMQIGQAMTRYHNQSVRNG